MLVPQWGGLPFVGRRRLRSFLARWYDERGEPLSLLRTPAPSPEASKSRDSLESSDGFEEAEFLKDYFQSQEQTYHAVLNFISQVSIHLNYWLDWATPVHRRPRWAHRLARKLWSSWLVLLGRPQITAPERCASQFARLNEELCRLLAFIQVSSFELLSSCLDSESDRCQALTKALQGLAWQTRAAASTAADLNFASSATRWRWPATSHLWEQVQDLEDISASEYNRGAKQWMLSQEELVKKGRLQLQQNDLAFEVMAQSMTNFIESSGQLSHWRKWWPLYSSATLGTLLLSWRMRLSNRSVRHALAKQAEDVVVQFLREWIVSPIEQLLEALFLRRPKDDLRVQLRDLRSEEETLDRMVSGFAKFARAESQFQAEATATGAGDQELPERYFEWSMTKPLSNVITGHLMESCMVQSQKLKVLLYASLYSIDAVMTQLKWDFLMAGVMPMTLHGKLPKSRKQNTKDQPGRPKGGQLTQEASCGDEVQRRSQARIPKAACRGPPVSARSQREPGSEPVRVAEPSREAKSLSPTRTLCCAPAQPRPRCSPCPGQRSPQPANWLPGRRQVGAPIDLPRQSVRTRLQGRMATTASHSHTGTARAWSPDKGGETFPGLPPEAADVSPDRGTSLSFNPIVNASSTTSTTSHVSPSPVYTPQLVTRSVGQPSTSLSPVVLAPVPGTCGTWAVRPPGLGIALTKAFSTTSLHSNAGPAKKDLVRL